MRSTFFNPKLIKIRTQSDWIDMFASAGCDQQLITNVLNAEKIKDIENLYERYNQLPGDEEPSAHIRKSITAP